MLVLTRRPNESICIGEHIKIEIISIDANIVTFSIITPRHLRVAAQPLTNQAAHRLEFKHKT